VTTTPWQLPLDDLAQSVSLSAPDLEVWRGGNILVTGGTGFLGSWLVAALIQANQILDLDLHIDVVTRSPDMIPTSVSNAVRLIHGDVRSLAESTGEYALVVHGAASSAATPGLGDGDPRSIAHTIVDGTAAVLEVAARTCARVLFLSSGAVYGRQTVPAVSEDDRHGPDPLNPRMAYGEAKRMAEMLCAMATAADEARVTMARLFAFVGPRIPLDRHFAVGNFIADALAGRPIAVAGDGSAIRTYLYCGDLPEWCWAVAARGRPGVAYNVGSAEPVTIAELAGLVANLVKPALPVHILGAPSDRPVDRYVPSTERAVSELGLAVRTEPSVGIAKSFRWFQETESAGVNR
jgi:nucleoside-diphosphate-sugar epimerase